MLLFLFQDFCPWLSQETKSPRNSIYHSSYIIDPSLPRPRPKPLAERRKHTNDLRETHFKLGTWQNAKTSETRHALSFSKHIPVKPMMCKQDTYGSKVFRPGDWNQQDRKSVIKSVTKNDFLDPDLKCVPDNLTYENQFTDKNYHQTTHFNLGNERNINGSVYNKDFTGNSTVSAILMVPGINPLNLFPRNNNESSKKISTKEESYQNHRMENTLVIRKDVIDQIKQRQEHHSIPMSDQNIREKHLSITSSDFPRPLFSGTEAQKITIPAYNHVSGNYYGPDSKISEAKQAYIRHQNTSVQVRNECCERRRDNKSTHFVFGTDLPDDIKTEQSSQYQEPVSLNPIVRAAGKGLPQKKAYSHILPQNVENGCFTGSVMKEDYGDPKVRYGASNKYNDGIQVCELQKVAKYSGIKSDILLLHKKFFPTILISFDKHLLSFSNLLGFSIFFIETFDEREKLSRKFFKVDKI